ncbi:hypothetical protein SCLCIDRAFT_1209799 [Scleroderma citrinum Foug A]|uniref:Response regulatory domain-containing protein n=1 Tax=Scleroderma citrinum Foug A TaxID=1036808 RepID=A0A0C3ARY8_9AGAM|nr:hypothetical protein SCLCIDRAFT_1209799 [Scleroderma citrinum Foug A]
MAGGRPFAHPRRPASLLDDGALLPELSSMNRFALTWAVESPLPFQTPLGHAIERSGTLSSSDGESDHSEREHSLSNERYSRDDGGDYDAPTDPHFKTQQPSLPSGDGNPDPHKLPRTFSLPSPSQLEHLQNPRRQPAPFSPYSDVSSQSDDVSPVHGLSLELADSVQMVVQTLLQISPAQILDPAKEQYAACSLLVPTTCMSAMLTTMKNLNFVSGNMSDLFAKPEPPLPPGNELLLPSVPKTVSDFDIGEMLQGVGDALSGCAAQVGVDLVLFHGDVGLRHVAVRGEEFALSTTLTHVIRQIINAARQGDSVDVGLSIRSLSDDSSESPSAEGMGAKQDEGSPDDGCVICAFEITHHFGESDAGDDSLTPTYLDPPPLRPKPVFVTPLLQRLFLRTGAAFASDLPRRNNLPGRICELTFRLECGSLSAVNAKATPVSGSTSPLLSGTRIAKEPTLGELTHFSETLRGKKATLYASATSSFAHHLTSYLTAWGLDVIHVSSEQEGETVSAGETAASSMPESSHHPKPRSRQWSTSEPHNAQDNSNASNSGARSPSTSLVFIDDDVSVLREQIQKFRAEQHPSTYAMYSRKRPSLVANHRPKSSHQVARAMGYGPSPSSAVTTAVIHFTSLANYKEVRDIIQCDLATHAASFQPPLEVMIIPKPAGPRRFLTALHTALTKPLVDPFFAPIATSPISPAVHGSPFFSHVQQASPKSPLTRPWGSTRSASDRSAKSPRDGDPHVLHPPSPLSIADTAEYFPDGSDKLGTAPASGLVISNPDGHPTGIVFNPRAKGRSQSSASTPGDKGNKMQFLMPKPERLRSPTALRPLHGDESSLPFSALHSVTLSQDDQPQSPTQTPTETPTSAQGKVRKPSVLADDVVPSTSPGATLPRRGSPVETRKVASQPASPNAAESPTSWFARRKARRAAQSQKMAMEGASANKSGKSTTETTIVPPISVLIVDDNPINRTILSTFMKKKKVKYDVAKNGEEAVEKWRSGNFQLILMDIQMPVMDGIEATKQIRNLESLKAACAPVTPQSDLGARTPSDDFHPTSYNFSVIIVALTASSLESDRVAALAAGCNDFLTKPVSLQWLNNKIIEWGAIKALQMWADMPSEEERSLSTEQSAQAQVVARRLHVPDGRATPVEGVLSRTSSKGRLAESVGTAPIVSLSTIVHLPTPAEEHAPRQEDPGDDATPPQDPEGKVERGDERPIPEGKWPSSDDVGKSLESAPKEASCGALPLLPGESYRFVSHGRR